MPEASTAAGELRQTADLLLQPDGLTSLGEAMLTEILTDGSGPLFRPTRPGQLKDRLKQVLALTT